MTDAEDPNQPGPVVSPHAAEVTLDPSDDRVGTAGWVRLGLLLLALVLLTKAAGPWGLVMVLGLLGMIFLHELGHFVMAKRAGMKVTEFFLGFGPRLWSFRRGETEYGIKLIPAGAYVRIIGMNSLEEVPPEDESRTYRAQPFWQRFGVAVAGSTMHFIQAFVLIFVVLAVTGTPGGTLALHSEHVPVWSIAKVYDHCPAQRAGLEPGDKIVAVDGARIADWPATASVLGARPGRTLRLTVLRKGDTFDRSVKLGTRTVDGKPAGMLGVLATAKAPPVERVGVAEAVPQTFREFGASATASISGLARLFTPSHLRSYGRQVADAQKDAQHASSPTTTVVPTQKPASTSDQACAAALASGSGSGGGNDQSTLDQQSRLTSIYGIFSLGKGLGQTGGFAALLGIFALINIFIGLFNLTPMLPFDGGHVVIAVYEKFQEWRLHRRERYLADLTRLVPLTYGVILVLGMIFVSSLYLDIVNPISVK